MALVSRSYRCLWGCRCRPALVVLLLSLTTVTLLAVDEVDPTTAFHAAVEQVRAEHWQAAQESLQPALAAWPDHPRLQFLQGIIAYHRGHPGVAIQFLHACLAADESALHPRARYYLVVALLDAGQGATALQQARRLLRDHPGSAEAERVAAALPPRLLQVQDEVWQAPGLERHGWRFRVALAGLYDDNPARLRDNEIILTPPTADVALRQAWAARWTDIHGREWYRLRLSSIWHREATVVDSVEAGQDARLFGGETGAVTHALWLRSRLDWLDGVITRHGEELRWESVVPAGSRGHLRLHVGVALNDFQQRRNDDLDAQMAEVGLSWQIAPLIGPIDQAWVQWRTSWNDTQDESYRRLRLDVSVGVGVPLGERWRVQGDGRSGVARFPALRNDDEEVRLDHDWNVGLALSWNWPVVGELVGEWRVDGRESNDDLFDFDRWQIILGWRWEW